MQGLSQWGALELIAEASDATYASMLDIEATWWSDRSGIAHGRPDHAKNPDGTLPEPVTGTLRDLCGARRHTKGCLSVTRAAGEVGAQAATLAQRLTDDLHGYDQLPGLLERDPVVAHTTASLLLARLPGSDDLEVQRVIRHVQAGAEYVRDEAFRRARSDSARAALTHSAADILAMNDPDSPIAELRRIALDESGGWHLARVLETYPIDDAWVTAVHKAIYSITPRSLSLLGVLDMRAVTELAATSNTVTQFQEAAQKAWKNHLAHLASEAPAWVQRRQQQASEETSLLAVVCADPSVWHEVNTAAHLAWADRSDTGTVVVPLPVAQALNAVAPAFMYVPLDRQLTPTELSTLHILADDADWEPPSLTETLNTAVALAS